MLTLNIRGATVTIPEAEIERLWLASVREEPTTSIKFPRIGSPWSGGVYAGVVRGDAGQRDYHLIVSAEEIDSATWDAARAWAKARGDDEVTWSLPQRKEQAILFGNVPELFEKEWYWSDAQSASAAGYAWAQSFGSGGQNDCRKGNEFRARAVLHIPVGEE